MDAAALYDQTLRGLTRKVSFQESHSPQSSCSPNPLETIFEFPHTLFKFPFIHEEALRAQVSVSQVLSMQIGKSLNNKGIQKSPAKAHCLGPISLSCRFCMKSWKTSKTVLNAEYVGKPIRFLLVECLESAIGQENLCATRQHQKFCTLGVTSSHQHPQGPP